MLDWNDLRVIRAVARAGSLAGAGRALAMHQTTIGRRLRAAEESLGATLFLRSSAGVVATAAAAQLFPALDALDSAVDALERRAKSVTAGPGGLVRLAVTETIAALLLPTALAELRARHPELTVELIVGNAAADLTRGEADCAVRLLAVKEPDFVRRGLGTVRFGLFASTGYLAARGLKTPPASKPQRSARGGTDWLAVAEQNQLDGHGILVPSRELALGPEGTWLAARATRAVPQLFANSLMTLAAAAADSLGMAVLPTSMAKLHPELVQLRALHEIPMRPVWLVMHRDLQKVTRVRRVATAVTKALRHVLEPVGE